MRILLRQRFMVLLLPFSWMILLVSLSCHAVNSGPHEAHELYEAVLASNGISSLVAAQALSELSLCPEAFMAKTR